MNATLKTLKERHWKESMAHSSWQIFKIMAEFVDGFEALSKIGPCISIFGSARTKPGTPYYELSAEIGQRLAAGSNTHNIHINCNDNKNTIIIHLQQ